MSRRSSEELNKRRSSSKGRNGQELNIPFDKMQLIRLELTAVEKSEFHELYKQAEFDVLSYLDQLVARGLSFKGGADKRGGGAQFSVTCNGSESVDNGCTLIGRGGTIAVAIAVTEYKDVYLAGDDGWRAAEDRRGGGYDDIG